MVKALSLVILLAVAAPAQAEVRWQLPSEGGRKAADIASWGTLFANIGLETYDAWKCEGRDRKSCLLSEALKLGTTAVTVFIGKSSYHRARPCAPDCGNTQANTSFPSGHSAMAWQAVGGGPHVGVNISLAGATSALRVLAGKHYPTDVLAGAGIGLTASWVW